MVESDLFKASDPEQASILRCVSNVSSTQRAYLPERQLLLLQGPGGFLLGLGRLAPASCAPLPYALMMRN
ncbi:hypothetical protein NHX12_030220 [Muraenolepis orangiensis]|uniref:Uncharacterized protein n=1 Tax=Muraenolepis orangiensis TaxID=630683 RepID=A0A9Q0EBN3_9TELE|nr:hypothetical protein NHX12_030220 [Muraenolepis orangiensis]